MNWANIVKKNIPEKEENKREEKKEERIRRTDGLRIFDDEFDAKYTSNMIEVKMEFVDVFDLIPLGRYLPFFNKPGKGWNNFYDYLRKHSYKGYELKDRVNQFNYQITGEMDKEYNDEEYIVDGNIKKRFEED